MITPNKTHLSVNVNKIATLRNARGGNVPNLIKVVEDCERFGAQGITVHPRPDERHIRYADVRDLKKLVKTEFNIEGRPDKKFMDLVLEVKPDQCTLVPDAPNALTSNAGWDTWKDAGLLMETILELKKNGIRVSLFVDPDPKMVEGASRLGTDRIELYTESYAAGFEKMGKIDEDSLNSILRPFQLAGEVAEKCGLGVNAGHDLNKENLSYFKEGIPQLIEVSIGHALISDALYLGLENAIQIYLRQLK